MEIKNNKEFKPGLKLSIWERLQLREMVKSLRGNAGTLKDCFHLIDSLDFTNEEKEQGDIKVTNAGISFKKAKEFEATININKSQFELLQQAAPEWQGWQPVPETKALFEKLGIAL